MIRTQIHLSEKQSKAVKEWARQQGISVAEYIRRAVDRSLDEEMHPDYDELAKRSIAAIGKFTADKTDVSTRHDDYLAEAYSQ